MPRLPRCLPLLRHTVAPRAPPCPRCLRFSTQDTSRAAVAESDSAHALPSRRPQGSTSSTPAPASLPPPRYHVSRSLNKNLPIYTDYKRGGNLHLTTIRKITGDLHALRDELRSHLQKKEEDVKINSLTGHVIVKGHHTPQIKHFLEARGM